MVASASPFLFLEPHHLSLAPIRTYAQEILYSKAVAGSPMRLSKKETAFIEAAIRENEQRKTRNGVNFSRMQIETVLRLSAAGIRIEFETLGPYLADYAAADGCINPSNLTPEDVIGLRLSQFFRMVFPNGRLVSLYDDYNKTKVTHEREPDQAPSFSPALKRRFHNSLVTLFKEQGVVLPEHEAIKDYLLISEQSKVVDAEQMVEALQIQGYIRRDDQMITFVNDDAENPLHRQIRLRTKDGRWLCEALDAATFWKEENLTVVHIVALPDYMRDQQDRVWEMLRILGIQPSRYHNIFFDPARSAQDVVDVVSKAFQYYKPGYLRKA